MLVLWHEPGEIRSKREMLFRKRDWRNSLCRNRPRERDVSEQIALGVQTATDTGVQYDQRLFNMSAVSFLSLYIHRMFVFVLRVLTVV